MTTSQREQLARFEEMEIALTRMVELFERSGDRYTIDVETDDGCDETIAPYFVPEDMVEDIDFAREVLYGGDAELEDN